MNGLRQLFCLVFIAIVSSCGGERRSVPAVIETVAYLQKLADGSYEAELRYSVTTSGGPCLSKDWFKTSTSYSTNWLYLKTLNGAMTADQIVVTTEAGKKVWPYARTNMQGAVLITNTTMIIRLESRDYDYKRKVETGYVSFFLNGTYRLRQRSVASREE